MEGENSDIILFFGRFHPLILHVPIGFLTIAFVLEMMSRFPRFKHFKSSVGFILLLGSLSAVLAAVLGLMLARSGDYSEKLLAFHQWTGIGVAGISLIAFALDWRFRRKPSRALDRSFLIVMWVMIISLGVTGHFGGSLTHGSDYLTRYMPNSLRQIAGLPAKGATARKKITDLNEAVVYEDIIHPILDHYCTSCHNDEKRKGELMMHTPEYLMKGGENGPALVPGNATSSDMIKRIRLPEDHDDHMPPEGKRQVSDDELNLLIWWVDEGASFDKKVAEVNANDEVKSILASLVDPDRQKSEVQKLLDSAINPVNEVTLAKFKQKGVMVSPLSNENHWLQADVAPGHPGDSLVKSFVTVGDQITWLNLGGTSTTDAALASLAGFKHLTRLHLGNTRVTDDGLKHLQGLPYLESLNLYGTQISDDGLLHLKGLKNLKKLYVWKTRVTAEGVSQLKAELPALEVIMGQEISTN